MRKLVFGAVGLGLALALAGCTAVAGASGSGQDKSTAPEQVTVQFRVNGEVVASGVEAFQADGQLYVPIGKVGYTTDRFVQWDKEKGEVVVEQRQASLREPLVPKQPWEFSDKVAAALALLREKAPSHYAEVQEQVAAIFPGPYNQAFRKAGIITLSGQTIKGTDVWVASAIAHEAEHLRLARQDPKVFADLKENERAAYRAGLDSLKQMEAPQALIDQEEQWVLDPPTGYDVIK